MTFVKKLLQKTKALPRRMLGRLFLQYNDGSSLRFGSKFSILMGNVFLGRPESRGLDVLTSEQRQQYYRITSDRMIPVEPDELQEWQREGIFVAQFRNFAGAQTALTVAMVGVVLCFAMVGGKGLMVEGVDQVKDAYHWSTDTVAGWFDDSTPEERKAKAEERKAKQLEEQMLKEMEKEMEAIAEEWPLERCQKLSSLDADVPFAVLLHCQELINPSEAQQ
jgi:hypothetical protein